MGSRYDEERDDRDRVRSRSRSPARGGYDGGDGYGGGGGGGDGDGYGGGGGGGGGGERVTGVAQRWQADRGFGFIRPDDGGPDLFCHFSVIQDGRALREGDKVEFVKRYDERKGKDQAEDVTGGTSDEGAGARSAPSSSPSR